MKKAFSFNLPSLLAAVICAVAAFGEPNYPPPGPEWLGSIRAISYVWAGGTGQWIGKTPEEYAADANAIASNGFNTVVLFGRQARMGSIQEWPKIVEELNELTTVFHQYGLRVFEHQSWGIVDANDINNVIPDSNNNSTVRSLLQIDAQTMRPASIPEWHAYNVCFINPQTQPLIDAHNLALFTHTGLDGLMDDDVGFTGYTCVCPYCRAKGIRDCGVDINN
jgi:hypothetical protein